ncbi:MAG: hypothetical protein ABIQ30_13995 [Devosia sp.]
MKSLRMLALAASIAFGTALPAAAGDVEDVVRANCTKQIINVSDATRNEAKGFPIVKSGNGYKMTGHTSSGQTVSCETDENGRVKWVKVS